MMVLASAHLNSLLLGFLGVDSLKCHNSKAQWGKN